MSDEARFEEVQRFARLRLVAVLLAGVGIVLLVAFYGDDPPTDVAFGVLVVSSIGAGLFVVRLHVRVDDEGLWLKFFPPDFSFRRVDPDQIDAVEVHHYGWFRLLTGWGVGARDALTFAVGGTRAVVIHRTTETDLVIGTQRPDDLAGSLEAVRGRAD